MTEEKGFEGMDELSLDELEVLTGGYLYPRSAFVWDVLDDKGNVVKTFDSSNSEYHPKLHAMHYAFEHGCSVKQIDHFERDRIRREHMAQ